MQSDVVCEHDFLHKAIEDEGEGQPEISLFHGERFLDLLEEMVGSDDGSSDQLWEKGSIGCEIHKGGIGRVFSTVHVNGIGHRLESVERDAHGQEEFSPRYVRQKVSTELHNSVRVDQHVEVLERRKEAQIEGQGCDEEALLGLLILARSDAFCDEPVRTRAGGQQNDVPSAGQPEKDVRCKEDEAHLWCLSMTCEHHHGNNDRREEPGVVPEGREVHPQTSGE